MVASLPGATQAVSLSRTYEYDATCPYQKWTAWALAASFAGVASAEASAEASVDGPRVPTSFEEGSRGVADAAASGYVAAFLASDRASLGAGTCRVSTFEHDQGNVAVGPSSEP